MRARATLISSAPGFISARRLASISPFALGPLGPGLLDSRRRHEVLLSCGGRITAAVLAL
jgi:hypothetical protein